MKDDRFFTDDEYALRSPTIGNHYAENKRTRHTIPEKIGVGVLAGLLLITGANNYAGKTEPVNGELYQGYRINSEGVANLVFDENPLSSRNGYPELTAEGNPHNYEIGKRYNLKIKLPLIFGSKRIITSKEATNYSSE